MYSRSAIWLAFLLFTGAVASGCGGGGGSSGGTPAVPPSANTSGTGTSPAPQPSPTATQPVIQTFALPSPNSAPLYITAGPDGNVWFTESTKIGRITTGGQVTEYAESAGQITTGPDGNLWYPTSTNSIGRISPAGLISHFGPFTTPTGTNIGQGITTGPDGNIWLAGSGVLLKISPQNGALLAQFPISACFLTSGSDGNLWATIGSQVERVTPSGAVTAFTPPNGNGCGSIALWTDGNVWFTEGLTGIPLKARVASISPSGIITEYVVPNAVSPNGIAKGPDGSLWIVDYNSLFKMTAAGQFVQYQVSQGNNLGYAAAGSDGNLWFTNSGENLIEKLLLH